MIGFESPFNEIEIRSIDPRKGNTMNEEITNTADGAFVAVPVAQLTDEELAKVLASKPAAVEADEVTEDFHIATANIH